SGRRRDRRSSGTSAPPPAPRSPARPDLPYPSHPNPFSFTCPSRAAMVGYRHPRRRLAMSECRKVRPAERYAGKQGFTYDAGIARESVGSTGICMHLLTIPAGGRARPHAHATHETAIYQRSGRWAMYWDERLQHRLEAEAADLIYIPADMPHLPFNPGPGPCTAVIARTDPSEQEGVALLPDLEAL